MGCLLCSRALHGSEVHLIPSVGATENLMLAAARGAAGDNCDP